MRKRNKWFLLRFDRILSQDSLRQVLILLAVLFIAFCFSFGLLTLFGGNWEDYCESKHISKWIFPLYLLIDGNAFSNFYIDNNVSKVAVLWAGLIYIVGVIIFTGMIISVMTNMIERRVEDHRGGHLHYLISGHYIIMGYDDMVPSFITHIFGKDKDAYVLILTSADAVEVKEKLSKSFNKDLMKRIIVNYGHRISQESYKDIHLETAEEVFVVGNRIKSAHDAINVECVDSICHYLVNKNQCPKRITCVFKDLDTYAAFKTSEIFKEVGALNMEFVPYNFFANWAKQVFVKQKYRDFENPEKEYPYPSVYGKGIKPDDNQFVHLVFVGTTNFAVAFAMEAAHVLHFPNFKKDGDPRTRITFVDKNADKEKDEFIIRNRHFFEVQSYTYKDLSKGKEKEKQGRRSEYVTFLGENADFLDVEFEFIKGDIFSKDVQDEIESWAIEHREKQYLSVFLATADQRQNFVMAMNMPDKIYENEVPIFIRQDRSDNFVTNLRNADKKNEGDKLTFSFVNKKGLLESKKCDARYANIYPFGMNETAYSADEHSLERAKLINYLYETANYDTYKFQGILALEATSKDKIFEEANAFWRLPKLTVALKWSNLYSAYAIRTKLASLRAMRWLNDTSHDYQSLTEYEVEEMARVEHNRWNVEKLLMGYRKPHEEEDKYEHPGFAGNLQANKKLFIHHDIRPFDKLGDIKELDKEFSRYIPWIMKMTEEK